MTTVQSEIGSVRTCVCTYVDTTQHKLMVGGNAIEGEG